MMKMNKRLRRALIVGATVMAAAGVAGCTTVTPYQPYQPDLPGQRASGGYSEQRSAIGATR